MTDVAGADASALGNEIFRSGAASLVIAMRARYPMKQVARSRALAANAVRRTVAHRVGSRAISAHLSPAENFIRPHILELAPYKPILPLDVLSGTSFFAPYFRQSLTGTDIGQLGIPISDIIKLDANENPYGPPQGESHF